MYPAQAFPNNPTTSSSRKEQLVFFSATLPPYLSLTSFNLLHSLALDFTDSSYLSSPEMACPLLGSPLPLLSAPIPSAGKPQHSSTAWPGQLESHFVGLPWAKREFMVESGSKTTPGLDPCLALSALPSPGCGASWADGLDLLLQLRFCCVMQEGGGGGGGGGRSWRGRRGGT